MEYWKLTTDCLYVLKSNWETYYYDRVDALEDLVLRAEEDYRNEGNDDLRADRYSHRSVQKWYDESVYKAKKWMEESIDELNEEHRKFLELWNQACSDHFDSSDYGYLIIYDFYRFEKRKEYCPDINSNQFRVRFSGQTHWYSLSGRRKDLEFKTGKPEFKHYQY